MKRAREILAGVLVGIVAQIDHELGAVPREDVPGVDLVFSAVGEDGTQDAARPSLTTGPSVPGGQSRAALEA